MHLRCAFQKPILARCFASISIVLVASSFAVRAQEPGLVLREADVVQRALERPDVRERAQGEASSSEGRIRVQGAYANPIISYSREQTSGTFGTWEDYLSIEQPIDLGNRVGLKRRAARARLDATKLGSEAEQVGIAAEARRRFYALMHQTLRQAALERWQAQLDEGLRIVAARQQQGDVALYDERRMERERLMVESLVERERIACDTSRQRLATKIGLAANQALGLQADGSLLPADLPDGEVTPDHPARRALAAQERAAREDEHVAKHLLVPDLRLNGGYKGVRLTPLGRSDGWMLGATLAVPLWDQGSGQGEVAAGEARTLRAQQEALTRVLAGDAATYRLEALRYRQLAMAQRAKTGRVSADLLRMVQAGYAGGELSIVEVLDAYRGSVEDELAVLAAEYASRMSAIAWLEAQGRGTP
jgi:cobalt-zinc-cadmium efflux system outer membrane protein